MKTFAIQYTDPKANTLRGFQKNMITRIQLNSDLTRTQILIRAGIEIAFKNPRYEVISVSMCK